MKIKKSSLEVLFNFAKGTEGILSLSESRIRDSFLKPLVDSTTDFIQDRNKIYETFSSTKEELPDNQVTYHFPTEKQEEVQAEVNLLLQEEVEVNFSDNPQQIKSILEKSEYKPKIGETEVFDAILKQI